MNEPILDIFSVLYTSCNPSYQEAKGALPLVYNSKVVVLGRLVGKNGTDELILGQEQ